MMELVDAYLRKKNISPHARPIQGWFYISGKLGLGLQMGAGQDREPRSNCYSGDDLSIRIFRWFDNRYGDKLKINFGPGRVFILIRHDPWIISFPKVYGAAEFFISPSISSSRPEVYLKQRAVPRFNVLESIQGLPKGLANALRQQELGEIFEYFTNGYRDMVALEAVEALPMVNEARSDIEASVHHATSHPPHFGQSKWCSLQATEKLLKAYLASKKKSFPKVHKLGELAGLAEAAGLSALDKNWIDSIQCDPGIRYGEEPTSLVQAWSAHWSAVRVCGRVARTIQR